MESVKNESNVELVRLFYNGVMNDYYRAVRITYNGYKSWAVVDCYGTIISPFFDGDEVKATVYSSNKCLAVGKVVKDGHKVAKESKAYDITTNGMVDGAKDRAVKFPYEITNASYMAQDRLLLETSNGFCIVDPNFGFQPVSDYYDRIYRNDKDTKWLYEKKVENDTLSTTINGEISTEGQVERKAYDSFFKRWRMLNIDSDHMTGDIIDTTPVLHDLDEKEQLNMLQESEKRSRGPRKAKIFGNGTNVGK